MATVGDDFGPYAERLDKLGLTQAHIRHMSGSYTAQAFITTDLDDNQITAFHPGAMNFSAHNHVGDASDISLGIVAPDGRDGMLQHAREFHEAGIPFDLRSGPGHADVQRRGVAALRRAGRLRDGQRLRGATVAGARPAERSSRTRRVASAR